MITGTQDVSRPASDMLEATEITFDIKLSNPTLTGSIGYAVDDSNRIRLARFTLSDGNPDITDGTVWYAPYTLGDKGVVTSDWFGNFWLVGYNYIYHHQLHWLYCTAKGDWLFAYSYDGLGWFGMSPKTYPFVYVYGIPSLDGKSTDEGWTYISQKDPTALRIYFYSGSRAGNWYDF